MKIRYNNLSIDIDSSDILELTNGFEVKSLKELLSTVFKVNVIFLNGASLLFGTFLIVDKIYLNHKKELYKLKSKEIDEKLF